MKALLVLMLVSSAAMAEDGALLRCRQLTDGPGRLACYDAIPLAPSAPANSGRSPGIVPQDKGGSPVPGGPGPVNAAATQAELERNFGTEQIGHAARLEHIESAIVGKLNGWHPNMLIKLANGQVWRIADDSESFVNLNSPKVKIERGALGSIFMDIDGASQSPKVKRVE